jgi:hypothetical protein
MKTKVKIDSKSNNVKRYVRAVWLWRQLKREHELGLVDTVKLDWALAGKLTTERALTGGQMAEARKILQEHPHDPNHVHRAVPDPVCAS